MKMSTTTKNIETKQEQGSLLFIKEVAKYFMDFLETDFHKHKLPRRGIKFRNNDNLLVGLNLQKYPSFNKLVSKLISKGFDKDVLNKVEKGVYKTNLPKNLLDLIKLQIGKISNAEITAITERIAGEIEKAGTLYAKEYDVALTNSVEETAKIIRSELVHPFVESVEKPLQNLNLGDEDNIYLIEEELTAVILRLLENKISEVLNLIIAQEKVNLTKELKSVFAPQDVKGNLTSFFENLQVADLFLELFEMERNKTILDKQDFYLYFGDISFNNNKYPIFYIPFSTIREGDALNIEFDSQVYINKKALEYVVQEYNVQKGTKGSLQTVSERIIYLSQHQNDFSQIISSVLNELSHFFELDSAVDFSNGESAIARSAAVRVSNSSYICLFDKSDEALVNDYEEILQELSQDGGILAEIFNKLIDDFVHNNPQPFNPDVEGEWDNTGTPDRLVYPSPIPLNSEQRQILSAVNKDGCNYIVVSGPPGTGKSHTITAIIFDAILKNQSVLVLSDKKEALDVVEDKITQTMNKVRYDKNFQNPILRLGKTGNTYNSILAQSAIDGIKTHHRAVKKDYEAIAETITKSGSSLKEDLEAEIIAYDDINIKEIHEFFDLELYFRDNDLIFDLEELAQQNEAAIELGDLRSSLHQIKSTLISTEAKKLFETLELNPKTIKTLDDYEKFLQFLGLTLESIQKIKTSFSNKIDAINRFSQFNLGDLQKLQHFIEEYSKIKLWAFGYLFSKKSAEELDIRFKQSFIHNTLTSPHEELQTLKNIHEIFSFAHQLGNEINKKSAGDFDYIALAHRLLTDESFAQTVQSVVALNEDVKYLKEAIEKYPKTIKKVGINAEQFTTIIKNSIVDVPELEFDKQIRYLNLKQKVSKDFSNIHELNYAARMKQIEDLVTTQVTYLLDGRLIDFYEHNRSDAQTLRNIIKNKQRFPRDEFMKLKEAFPCILAGIRDYAEYIPLESGLFDLVVIDEASQVSIAQAFPALLRAKKVLILGDKKQFSNIKAAQARGDTNREYLNGLGVSFRDNVSSDAVKLVRLDKFNIKTSILEFFEFISNYNIQLLKHFRGYKEIISYSNKYFYQESLQVMKIRGKSIDDVVKFSNVESTAADELYPNTNKKEVEFIISELKRLKDEDKAFSVGIITPHTNQQKLLVEMIGKMPEWDYFQNKLQLKIMTFDTCQGEERDIIYYSMVASPHSDKLWGVFIKDLSNVDIEEDGQIKAQRLNVGFSRAKECAHFVLSQPIESFTGSVGEALRHYQYVLEEARKEHSVSEVDEKSKMEPEVLNWFYQTKFWQQHKDTIEFMPQFEIGKYLKQLDRTYTHPAYKVDFLLIYTDERHKEHKIIIEYDGFREHFKDIDEINEFNYEHYYTDEDVYRQKVLESYGYKFLRINKFNIGENPIANLDDKIGCLLKNPENANSLLANIHGTIEGLQNGEMRECPKCKNVKSVKDFKDASLITGYGRFCNECKNHRTYYSTPSTPKPAPVLSDQTCPRCGNRMVLRNGRRGKFYGCSKFPYCKGTRNF
jgi:superfamily I DNA and/or RNA helicase/very-short-patch-repair endonuclease